MKKKHPFISNFAVTLDTVIKHYEWELERISFSEEEQAHTDEWLAASNSSKDAVSAKLARRETVNLTSPLENFFPMAT